MFGFNWFDALIILVLLLAIYRGVHDGFFTQALTNIGLFGGLFLGGWIFPHLLPIKDPTTLTIVNSNLVLLTACALAIRGFLLGRHMHLSLGAGKMFILDRGLSAAFTTVSVLALVWIGAAALGRLPFEGLSNSANDARIVQALDSSLPPVPAVFAQFSRLINPNSPPQVLAKAQASSIAISPNQNFINTTKAQASVVRITSFGCGGVVSGSGFVVNHNIVATNAHVIAGVHRPIIKYGGQSYAATPILFDSGLDFALLRTGGLEAPPLPLHEDLVTNGTAAAILGYPRGSYATLPGVITRHYPVEARSIYGVGLIPRDAYEVQARVSEGASGGPLVLSDGSAGGILFARLPDQDVAFALTARSLVKDIERAKDIAQPISTGACLAS